jgi:hypothetical protein
MSDTPRTTNLIMLMKMTPEFTKEKDTDLCRALHLCRELETELAEMNRKLMESVLRANALDNGCHMAIGYIQGTNSDPEKSGTYKYLKSIISTPSLKNTLASANQ